MKGSLKLIIFPIDFCYQFCLLKFPNHLFHPMDYMSKLFKACLYESRKTNSQASL